MGVVPSCHLGCEYVKLKTASPSGLLSCGSPSPPTISSPGQEVVLSCLWPFLKYQTLLHHGAPTNSLSKPGTERAWQLLKFPRGSCSRDTLITVLRQRGLQCERGSSSTHSLLGSMSKPSPGLPGGSTEKASNELQLPVRPLP